VSAVVFDPNSLTFGDLEEFESLVGQPLQRALAPKPVMDDETGEIKRDEKGRPVKEVQPSARAILAIVWLVKRKNEPGLTLDDVRQIRVTELAILTEPDPKDTES
jgi:hypothetical protein